jgi:pimeloyl-ACP methyl ester carboxylesterase
LGQAVAGTEAVVERFSIPVLLGVLCSEDVPFWEPSQDGGPFATAAMRDNARATCKSWSVPPAPPEFRTDVTAPVPTLLLSGANDPATPPHLAQRIAGALPRSLHVVTPRLGHLPTWTSCHATIAAAFIEAGSLEGLDVGCAGVPPGR